MSKRVQCRGAREEGDVPAPLLDMLTCPEAYFQKNLLCMPVERTEEVRQQLEDWQACISVSETADLIYSRMVGVRMAIRRELERRADPRPVLGWEVLAVPDLELDRVLRMQKSRDLLIMLHEKLATASEVSYIDASLVIRLLIARRVEIMRSLVEQPSSGNVKDESLARPASEDGLIKDPGTDLPNGSSERSSQFLDDVRQAGKELKRVVRCLPLFPGR